MSNRDSKGKFTQGNNVRAESCKPDILKRRRKETREEVVAAAHSLLRPWNTLSKELTEGDKSRLSYLTAQAVTKHNTKFIQWLLEMAIGKPKLEIDASVKTEHKSVIRRTDGTVIEYFLEEASKDSDDNGE